MPWAKPLHNKSRVDTAGDILANPSDTDTGWEGAIEIISNWRSSHGYPLQVLKMTLKNRAKAVDRKALIAQRLKRMSSIAGCPGCRFCTWGF
jgi:hypothetical protein